MIDFADSCFKGVNIRNKDKISWKLVPKNNRHGEKCMLVGTDRCVNLSVIERVHVTSENFRVHKI